MKKIIGLILLSIILSGSSFAQWRVIYANEKYNYLISSQSDSIIRTTIWVDSSIVIGGDSVFYLNKIYVDKGFYNGTNYPLFLINQSQFLKSQITLLPNNVQQISGDENWFINGNCNAGDSWIFDSIANKTAVCDSAYLTTFFGITDSVKRITVDLTDTILLSKNYGVLVFPQFDSTHLFYDLVGLEIQNAGMTVPNALAFYDYNVGDEFEYQISYKSHVLISHPYNSSTETGVGFEKYSVQSKVSTNDSISYVFLKKRRMEVEYSNGSNNYTSLQVDTGSLYSVVYKLSSAADQYNGQYKLSSPSRIEWYSFQKDILGSGYRKYVYGNYYNQINSSDSIVVMNIFASWYPYDIYEYNLSENFSTIKSTSESFNIDQSGSSSYSNANILMASNIDGVDYGLFQSDNTYTNISSDSIYNNFIESDTDTLLDGDTTVILYSHLPLSSYQWSTGQTTDTIEGHSAGLYTLHSTNIFGQNQSWTKKILTNKNVYLVNIIASTLFICDSSEAILSISKNGFHYLWSTGSTTSSIKVNAPGTYYLTTTDAYGFTSVKSVLITNTETVPFNWSADTVLGIEDFATIEIPSMYDTFIWNDGNITSERTFSPTNLEIGKNKIWASATKNTCTVSDTIIIIRSPDENAIEENFYQFFSIENGELYLLPTAYDYTYEIYSTEGKLLIKGNYTSGLRIQPFTIKSINSGIYLLRITTRENSYTGKVFIRN